MLTPEKNNNNNATGSSLSEDFQAAKHAKLSDIEARAIKLDLTSASPAEEKSLTPPLTTTITTTTTSDNSDNSDNNAVRVIEGQRVVYRAYRLSAEYDDVRQVYPSISLFELIVHQIPLNVRVKKWYRTHPDQPVLMTLGEDRTVVRPAEIRYYSDSPSAVYNYNILVDRLTARRFFNVPEYELQEWKDSCRAEADAVLVEEPLTGYGGGVILQILSATNEIDLLHPVLPMSRPELSRDEYDRHNYSVSFESVPAKSCAFLDCALHYKDIEVLEQPVIVKLGSSLYDHEVVAATQRYRARLRKKLRHLRLMKTALLAIDMTTSTLDVLDTLDQADDANKDSNSNNNNNNNNS